MAAVILAALMLPFVRRRNDEAHSIESINHVASAETLRHLLYREPVTLRNEYEAGNISIEEYKDQLDELRLEAANLMRKRSEHRTRLLEAELELEKEVQRVREMRVEGKTRDYGENG